MGKLVMRYGGATNSMRAAMLVSMRRALITILELLSDGRQWRGLELVTASGGALSRLHIYLHLTTLIEQGLVTSQPHDDGHTRYSLPKPARKTLTA